MDFYKDLGQAIQNNISDNWDTVIVKIESSLNKMCSFQAEYTLSSFEKKELKFPLLTVNTLMDSVFEWIAFLTFKNLCRLSINGTKQFTHLKRTVILI